MSIFRRYFWTYQVLLILLVLFLLRYQLSFHHYSPPSTDRIQPSRQKREDLFSLRSNQRIFYLGQRYSHINVDFLLSIQETSNQTLTYYCAKNCGGWGDRLRGITSTYVLSVFLKRRFLIDMRYTCDLSNFLVPNLIDWTPSNNISRQASSLKLDSINSRHRHQLYLDIASLNLSRLWSTFDHIFLTTNSDYVAPILKNAFFNSTIAQLRISPGESSQQGLFAFIFELLFQPTLRLSDQLNTLLHRSSSHSMICMHIRLGQNPSIPTDAKFPYRQSLVQDMMEFIDRNLTHSSSFIFVTSDSMESVEYLRAHYGGKRLLTIDGPIVHIDRFNPKLRSSKLMCDGFLKVIADFYLLGECDTLLMPRSGFSQWASRRRVNEYANLYMYCRGIHRVTNARWKRPHTVC